MNIREIERQKRIVQDENQPEAIRRRAAQRLLALQNADAPAPAPAPAQIEDVAAAIKKLFDDALDEMRERDEAEAAKRYQHRSQMAE